MGMEAISKDEMQFTVAVPIIASELSVLHYDGLEYLDFRDGETYLRFSVKKAKDRDGEDVGEDCIVPFQVAYAVSVHKAQGLEYSSVKLIITKDVEERITHSVFYTAITRARERLHIYWSPESQNKILSSFEISKEHKDAYLLSNRRGLKIQRNNGWPSVCHWLRLRRNFVSSCALEYNLILRNSADIIVLGHLNRQIVHCRFLSAADLMSLSNAGLDHADTDRVDSQYLAVLMRANTHSLAAADTTLWTLIII